ncbi:MAG: hypothetical protein FWE35_23835 [Streptosporangiales bacterium]|nr:hypothetical protein [Streptosporangiales bacterium]
MITGAAVTEITEFYTKSDMSRWTRAHADSPGINWSVFPGPGGTMIVVEHQHSRSTVPAAQPAPAAVEPVVPAAPVEVPAALDFLATVSGREHFGSIVPSVSSCRSNRSSWAPAFA